MTRATAASSLELSSSPPSTTATARSRSRTHAWPSSSPAAARPSTTRKWHTETIYAITDLDYGHIRADQLADALRGHWGIENRLHWIRDVVFAEDHSQIRTGTGPAVMATLRNLAVSLHRLNGAANIAAACRHVSRHPNRVLPLLT